jgi:glycosyltransferase involved in cell wall biosynthesis
LLEAAQRSVPFVATAVGSVPEVFGETLAPLIVSPRDETSLANAMRHLLVEPQDVYRTRRVGIYGCFNALSSARSVSLNLLTALEQIGEKYRLRDNT